MASIINLSFLLLLLSGDVELNPGPVTPKDILQKYSEKLSKAISANINNVTNALHAKDLITPETRGYVVTTVGVANGQKANTVMLDIEGQLDASLDEKQYLTKVCIVLSNQGGAIKQIANVMLQELDGAAGGTTAADSAATAQSKKPTLGNLMRACAPSASHYSLIGLGLDVNVADLQPLPSMTTTNLTTVFQRWIDSNKDVTWGKLLQVCDDFSNDLGRMKADIQKFLAS